MLSLLIIESLEFVLDMSLDATSQHPAADTTDTTSADTTSADTASADTAGGGSLVVLAIDTGSPTVSVALARDGVILSQDVVDIGHSSRRLLPMIDATLADAGVAGADLSGLVALAGPGSFTGLRVGLATTLGLHQALGVPAAAVPTLPTLARTVLAEVDGPGRVFALVDVLRDEWACQEFELTPAGEGGGNGLPGGTGLRGGAGLRPLGEAARIQAAELLARVETAAAADDGTVTWLVGFGVDALEPRLGEALGSALGSASGSALASGRVRLRQPAGLAPVAATAATLTPPSWDAGTLTAPLYFRPPATTKPKKHLPGGRSKRHSRSAAPSSPDA